MYYLGIDGCGKYTKLLMLDENNKIIGRHSGVPTDLRLQPAASVAHNITLLVKELHRLTNTTVKGCAGLCFAAPSSEIDEHEASLVKMFKNIGFVCAVKVIGMERASLAAKIGDVPGVLLLSGDDVYGYIWRGGKETFTGGYGKLIEMGGSAYSIGANALRRIVMFLDGRGSDTSMAVMAARELGVREPAEILNVINGDDFKANNVCNLAGVVEKAARDGDGAALEIETQAARDLAAFGAGMIIKARTDGEGTHMVIGGPVLLLNESIATQLNANLRTLFPDIHILLGDEKAELGAAMLAR
ncbi:MAG: hypothetical protein FWE91_06745 [Defluviitaleaceae bacterium]|nr:hypothetical protein [Defluviitaleaceae bacterium]MCL2836634.1 hypothetical protein [Defluviitaleaceae bacterium]